MVALLLALGGFTSVVRAQDPVISEFLASNSGNLADEDGTFADWIEIHNPALTAVNLNGWSLTDNAANKTKWIFPSVTIPARGYLIVFASDKNRRVPGANLHTNFRLGASGEYLGLIKPDGVTVASEYAPTFPPQQTDVSYGMSFTGTTTVLLASGASVRTLVPRNNALGTVWTAPSFNDATWVAGTSGVGYERASGYEPLIGQDVGSLMYGITSSSYSRFRFNLTNPALVGILTLRMKYDDGFVAYLNGVRVTSANAPDAPSNLSQATTTNDDSFAVQFQDFDLTPFRSALVSGINVLAIHGLNAGSTSSDYLILPQLEGSRPGAVQPNDRRFFVNPTPGGPNGASEDVGPMVNPSTHSPLEPTDAQDVVVTSRVSPVQAAVTSVLLTYRVNFGAETTIPMLDNGLNGDGLAEDGVYGARIPASVSGPGQMVRYFIVARDASARTSRWPLFQNASASPQYFGWMVADPASVGSLPTLHWWVQDPDAARTDAGTRATVFYRGELYDNVFVRLRGQSSAWWPKPHYKFDFNSGYYFQWSPDAPRSEEFNLQSTFSDKSYLRALLAWETYRDAGVPYLANFPVRVQQNGTFHSVAQWLEQPDERSLTRNGMDGDGALYKMYNELTDATNGVEKRSRPAEDNTDLAALVNGIQREGNALDEYLFDHIDLPGVVNYIAATNLMNDNDHVAKNYYVYRDSDGNGEWTFFPWDKDLTFGRNYWNWDVLNDVMIANVDPQSHPLFGDRDHPKIDGPWNRLIDAATRSPRVRPMILRRLRTLMDTLLQPPGTPYANRRYEQRIDALVSSMNADVTRDRARWGNPYGEDQSFATAVQILKTQFLDVRRQHLFVTHSQNSGLIPPAQVASAAVEIDQIEADPSSGKQDEEYIALVNRQSASVDLSGWTVSGDVTLTMKPGTVLGAGQTLYLSPDVRDFRARPVFPKGGQGLFVQGDYEGHLPRSSQTIVIKNLAGVIVDSLITAPIAGTVVRSDYAPVGAALPVTVEVKELSSGRVETTTQSLGAGGSFAVPTHFRGDLRVRVRGDHWLWRAQTVTGVTNAGVSNLSFSLVNGDIDGDNLISVFDYDLLSQAFDTVAGHPQWNPLADLDGDGSVTVFDYDILSQNFDAVGDE